MNRFPDESTATAVGPFNCALVAAPPSPEYPGAPVPAIVEITPPDDTSRTRWFPVSAINRLPNESTATAAGLFNTAEMACPPSPANPAVPFPATVEIVP